MAKIEIFHQSDVQTGCFIPQRLSICRPADAKAGVLKFALLCFAVLRQLAERCA
ncbi:hypothetical protein D3C76_1416340 [compost metagenome]